MDDLSKIIEWLLRFATKWLKIVMTVACISSFSIAPLMLFTGIAGLAEGKQQEIMQAWSYIAIALFFLFLSPVLIYKIWSGKWIFYIKWKIRRGLARQNFFRPTKQDVIH
ncbi:hypothetical protein KTD26_30845 [Burkholderia multivorans]|uniref:hypothetical protein n=1 Tax=Burkholderia multivorans TaxID=87883 RepID=UPI001C22E187|nr:hypothetical protein [Burkholderia multivorans]MBU9146908.1 hypothetical protein [Burkholderia multivorans]MBU9391495.1 hypothetical protein [Burkholderia multivorans]HEF4774592.1 hypothetical protein [Burkholderia multivorans]